MSKYSSDDNRSMQLNDNNERYYSSRGYDDDDDEYDYEEENLNKPQLNVDEEGFAKYFYQYIDAFSHDLSGPRFQFDYTDQEHRELWFYYMVRAARDWCSSIKRNPSEYQLRIPRHFYDSDSNFRMINNRIKNHSMCGLEEFEKNWLPTSGHGYIPITSENGLKNE
jgi:hypothetical protein